jgi:hypothetical protein
MTALPPRSTPFQEGSQPDTDLLLIDNLLNDVQEDPEDISLRRKIISAALGSLYYSGLLYENLSIEYFVPSFFLTESAAVGTMVLGSYVNSLIERNISRDLAKYVSVIAKIAAVASLFININCDEVKKNATDLEYSLDSLNPTLACLFQSVPLGLLKLAGPGVILDEIIKIKQQMETDNDIISDLF